MSRVALSQYSPEWAKTFVRERDLLAGAFDLIVVTVEHIGSTAVPGLSAKPVIDIVLGAPSLVLIESRIDHLGTLGYEYRSRYEQQLPLRRYFVKQVGLSNRIHLHAVEQGKEIWRNHLAFRDMLRSDPPFRARYEALKTALAAKFAHDKAAYSAAKAPFIQSALAGLLGTGNAG